MKKFFEEFKAFISKGSVVDMAIAVIIGGAFGKIVTSLVNSIIMPLISVITGGTNVSDWKWVIQPAVYDTNGAIKTAETSLLYGNFLQAVIDFLIISFFIFIALKTILAFQSKISQIANKNKKQEEAEEEVKAETTEEILKDIRDMLKANKK